MLVNYKPVLIQGYEKRLTLTVVIPCYNEVTTIERILQRVEAVGLADEIIVVDDGSTDGSRDILKQLEAEARPAVVDEVELDIATAAPQVPALLVRRGGGVLTPLDDRQVGAHEVRP